MKLRISIFLAVSAILTLSFTFGSSKHEKSEEIKSQSVSVASEPVGGIISEDQL
jgi:hypothetical protein